MLEYNQRVQFTSTGATAWEDATFATEHAIYVETGATSSAVWQVETRMNGGTALAILSSGNLGASTATRVSLTGQYDELRVRLTDSTGTVTIRQRGNS